MVEVELHEGDVQAAALDLDFSLVNYAKYVKDIVRGCGEGNVEEVCHCGVALSLAPPLIPPGLLVLWNE